MLIAIAYDITDDRRRNKMAKLLSRYGNRVQYSLFEAEITEVQFGAMQTAVKRTISEQEDSVRYYLLGSKPESRVKIEGLGERTYKPDYILI
jgi:CRISPR-associated protein Cas2